jgi:hypothetical protein
MQKGKVILLIVLVLALIFIFVFSSWTNSLVVSEGGLSSGLNTLSIASSLLAGVFVMAAIALAVLISLK